MEQFDDDGNLISTAHEVTDPEGNVFISLVAGDRYQGRDGYKVVEVRGYAKATGFKIAERVG